jgi:DNA uptake protein ComE-like DNA-binding protein
MNSPPVRSSRAFVLVAVLVVIMLVSMIAVSLMFCLKAEQLAAAAGTGSEQAWSAAMSGVYAAMRLAAGSPPGSTAWQDQPETLRDQLVFTDGAERWYFSVFAAGDAESGPVRYGLSDEASKLNVLEANESQLVKLPRITTAQAQALLDFLDVDNVPRTEGAEQDYYNQLRFPYLIRDGTLETLEEILLVRGFGPEVLYGEDANFNYRLDPNEDDGDAQFPPDDQNGTLNLGLRQYLTVSSYDRNKTDQGLARINLNDPSKSFQEADFPDSLVKFIAALRRSQKKVQHPAELLQAKDTFKDTNGVNIQLESGVDRDELPLLLDRFTVTDEENQPGLINVNTASAQILQTVPGITAALAESIVSTRRLLDSTRRKSIAWLYQENLVDADLFKKLAPYVTARSFQFRFNVIGFGWPSGHYRVLEALVDLGPDRPTVSYLRDITRLGLPLDIRMMGDEVDG